MQGQKEKDVYRSEGNLRGGRGHRGEGGRGSWKRGDGKERDVTWSGHPD